MLFLSEVIKVKMYPLLLFFLSVTATVWSDNLAFARSTIIHGMDDQMDTKEQTLPQKLFVYNPFQNAPAPGPTVDPKNLNPYGIPDSSEKNEDHQSDVRFDRCLDTDRCVYIRSGRDNRKERKELVALFGLDVPHLRKGCDQEKVLANAALEFMNQVLSEAIKIDIFDHYQVGRTHIARVVVDGQDLSELLLSQGLAAPKGFGKKNWCID